MLLGLRKLRSSKKAEILQIRLILRVEKWKNIIFYHGRKKQRFFLIFTNEIIFYSAELFVCAVNFKFYLNIFTFLNIKTNGIKAAIVELRSSHLFWDQPYKGILQVKCQACNFTGILSFTGDFEDFSHIFPTCFFAELFIFVINLPY